jgi:hypothetical protein
MTEDADLDEEEKKLIRHDLQKMDDSSLANLIGDPDDFKDSHGIQDYNEHIVDEIKRAFTYAVEDAQRSADEDEYWKLFTNPVKEFFGEPTWVSKKVKKFDKETGKEKMEDKQFLKFKMSYGEFLDLLKDYEEYNSSDDEYSVRIKDGKIYPADIISGAMKQREEKLDFNEPYYGVNGDIDEGNLNERFFDRLHEELSEELKNAKVVVKKKKK